VDLRAELLDFCKDDPQLAVLAGKRTEDLLASCFDVGFWTMQQIKWESPASLLDKN